MSELCAAAAASAVGAAGPHGGGAGGGAGGRAVVRTVLLVGTDGVYDMISNGAAVNLGMPLSSPYIGPI